MKRSYFFIIVLIAILLYSCDDDLIIQNYFIAPVYYHVMVDTLIIPDSSSIHDTLYARLCGTLGPSFCYTFSNLEVNWKDEEVTLKVIGKQVFEPCISAFSCLNENYKLYDLKPGYVKIKIINPGNQFIRDSVFIY